MTRTRAMEPDTEKEAEPKPTLPAAVADAVEASHAALLLTIGPRVDGKTLELITEAKDNLKRQIAAALAG